MKWVKFQLLVLAWVVIILLGRYVDRGWYMLVPFAAFPTLALLLWIFSGEHTPEELERYKAERAVREAVEQAEWERRLELSPKYREERIAAALYERAQSGDVAAMKAYLEHQDAKARRPQHGSQWTPTDYMLGNG